MLIVAIEHFISSNFGGIPTIHRFSFHLDSIPCKQRKCTHSETQSHAFHCSTIFSDSESHPPPIPPIQQSHRITSQLILPQHTRQQLKRQPLFPSMLVLLTANPLVYGQGCSIPLPYTLSGKPDLPFSKTPFSPMAPPFSKHPPGAGLAFSITSQKITCFASSIGIHGITSGWASSSRILML